MKIFAIRSLAQYSEEAEISKLMDNFLEILIKRSKTTPYNYQEYELLRGQNSLPYLIKRYNYECFKKVGHKLELQYEAMPEAFKGHFTYDESGDLIELRSPNKMKQMMEEFWNKQRNMS